MINKNIYFLKIYAAFSVGFLKVSEWRCWADVLIKMSDIPKKWVIEMSSLDGKTDDLIKKEIFCEIEWSSAFNSLKEDFELSFIYMKNNLNNGDDNDFLNLAVGGGYFSDAPVDFLINRAKMNLEGCISFFETMDNMEFLKKNSWIYNQ